MLHLILFTLIILLFPINAIALEINDKGATTLKSSFQKLLDYQKMANEEFGTLKVIYEGGLNVEQNKDYYKITFPNISLKGEKIIDNTPQLFTLKIDSIIINASPSDKENYWNSDIYLPNKITLSDEYGDDFIIEFTPKKFNALFNSKLSYFTKLDVNLSNLITKEGETSTAINIGDLIFYLDMNENNNNDKKFSGTGYFIIKNIEITNPNKKRTISAKEIRFDILMDNLKLITIDEYSQKIYDYSKTIKALNKLDKSDINNINIDSNEISNMILDLNNFDLDNFHFGYSIKNLNIISDNSNNNFKNNAINSAFINLKFNNLKTENGELHIDLGHNIANAEIYDRIDNQFRLIPKNTDINIKITDIPYKSLSNIGANLLKSATNNPDKANIAAMNTFIGMPLIFSKSGTKMIFKGNIANDNIYNIDFNGDMSINMNSSMGIKTKVNTKLKGIDNIISYIKNTPAPYNDRIIYIVDYIKNYGIKQNNSYILNIETSPKNGLLINGQKINNQ